MTIRRYDPADPVGAVRDVLSALGGAREFDDRLRALTELDQRACDELFHALLRSGHSWPGMKAAHPRDVVEDGWYALVAAARAWPRRFLELTLAAPDLHRNLAIIDALKEIDAPEARDLLAAAARDRRAGHQYDRYFALQALVRQRDARLPELLVDLVRDRARLVQSVAIEAALGHGDARLIPVLQRIAAAPETPDPMRNAALDAIRAIARREGLAGVRPDPEARRRR